MNGRNYVRKKEKQKQMTEEGRKGARVADDSNEHANGKIDNFNTCTKKINK